MKRVSLFLSFALFSLAAFAQGNLQFNQVINFTITTPTGAGNGSGNVQSVTVTVPAGKVWKIESANVSYQYASSSKYYVADATSEITQLVLDGAIIVVESDDFYKTPGPIWLSEGTHTFILQGYLNTSALCKWNAFITGIEFNVTP